MIYFFRNHVRVGVEKGVSTDYEHVLTMDAVYVELTHFFVPELVSLVWRVGADFARVKGLEVFSLFDTHFYQVYRVIFINSVLPYGAVLHLCELNLLLGAISFLTRIDFLHLC